MKYPGNTRRQTVVGIVTLLLLAGIIAAAVMFDGTHRRVGMLDGYVMGSSGAPAVNMEYSMDSDETAWFAMASSGGKTAAEVDQKIIKTGYLTITVDGVSAKVQDITSAATAVGGFVQSSSVSESPDGDISGYVTIRVPAAQFESTMQRIKELAVHVETESSDGQDVTEHYTDLEARLNASIAQETQYLLILEDASTVGEVLAVQEHLAEVRANIESLAGQIQYLTNQTEYSTISVSISEETKVTIPSAKFDLVRDMKEAAKFVIALGQFALTGLVWLIVVGAPIAALAWAFWKLITRTRKT